MFSGQCHIIKDQIPKFCTTFMTAQFSQEKKSQHSLQMPVVTIKESTEPP